MAFASASNFTVPASGVTNQGLLMPKLKFRFRATFANFGTTTGKLVELTKQVADIKRPSVQFTEIPIDIYNSKVYLAGKPEWQTITVNLRDDAGNNVAQMVGEQVQKQFDFLEQASASSGVDYKFSMYYDMLDGGNATNNGSNGPTVLESWEINGCFIQNVDYGEMNYGSSEAAMIALTIRYDNAIQTPNGIGVGTLVGQTIGAITG
jgi:hypothetical protein